MAKRSSSILGTGWTEHQARRDAKALLATAGIQVNELRPLRVANNAVFQVDQRYVIRVARPDTLPTSMQHEVQVATALAAADVPVIQLATLAVPQPLVANGTYGTLWNYVPHGPRPTYQQFGRALRGLHEHTDSVTIPLPDWQPLASARQRLDSLAENYPRDDIALLEQWYERIRAMLISLQSVLPPGVIHGQAEIGNVLVREGNVIFVDFERVARGMREWDLIDTAVTTLRFNLPPDHYQAFAEAYGFDVMAWGGFTTLRRVWELRATTWLMQARNHRPEIADEVKVRLSTWRDDDPERLWHAL